MGLKAQYKQPHDLQREGFWSRVAQKMLARNNDLTCNARFRVASRCVALHDKKCKEIRQLACNAKLEGHKKRVQRDDAIPLGWRCVARVVALQTKNPSADLPTGNLQISTRRRFWLNVG